MSKEWSVDIASENFKILKDYSGYRTGSGWEADATRCNNARYGTHFSKIEEQEIIKFRQAPLPINLTTAICDTADALMVSSKPVIRVAPIIFPYNDDRTAQSKKVGAIYNSLLQKSWYDSLAGLHHNRVVRDSTNVGHGLHYVVPRFEHGEFTVDIKHILWKYFYPDPNCKDPFYRDSDNMVYAMPISPLAGYKFVRSMESDVSFEEFEKEWIKAKGYVGNALSNIASRYIVGTGGKIREKPILFIQRLSLEEQTVFRIIPTIKGVAKRADIQFQYKTYTELTPELKQQEADGLIDIEEDRELRLTEYTSVAGRGYKVVYPIDAYNIIPLTYDHRDDPYPLGRVWYLYPLQRAVNKFIMIAILNGSMQNSLRVLAESKSIRDVHQFRKDFVQAGSVNFWDRITPETQPPIIIEGKPLSNEWLEMPKYLAYIMEYVSGIFGVMQGDSSESPSVFSTVASLQSAGGQKIKQRLQQVDATLSIVGEVAGKFYREYAPPMGYATIINPIGETEQTEAGEDFIKYNVMQENPEDKTKVKIVPATDLSTGFRSIRFSSQGSSGYESATEAAMLTTLATQLKVAELIPMILKRVGMPDVDKVIEDISTVRKLTEQNQNMEAAYKKLEQTNSILMNQILQGKITVEAEKGKSQIKDIVREVQTQLNSNGV